MKDGLATLFVGGPLDGTKKVVDTRCVQIMVPVAPDIPISVAQTEPIPDRRLSYRTESYTVHSVSLTQDKMAHIGVHESLRFEQAVFILMDMYTKGKEALEGRLVNATPIEVKQRAEDIIDDRYLPAVFGSPEKVKVFGVPIASLSRDHLEKFALLDHSYMAKTHEIRNPSPRAH